MIDSADAMIDSADVTDTFKRCLFTDEEVSGIQGEAEAVVGLGAVAVDGIMHRFGFHPKRLKEAEPRVRQWLAALPDNFHKQRGGGWSFLQACVDRNGHQWTGMHVVMEELFCLGLGLGLVRLVMPREFWPMLPGGMPYYVIDLDGPEEPADV